MSKTLALLKKAQENRVNASTPNAQRPLLNTHYSILTTTIFIIALIISNIVFIFMANRSSSQRDNTVARLSEIKALLVNTETKLNSFAAVTDNINSKTEANNKRIKELEEEVGNLVQANSGNTFAIENLTKAKNTLFNKINSMDAKLNTHDSILNNGLEK